MQVLCRSCRLIRRQCLRGDEPLIDLDAGFELNAIVPRSAYRTVDADDLGAAVAIAGEDASRQPTRARVSLRPACGGRCSPDERMMS